MFIGITARRLDLENKMITTKMQSNCVIVFISFSYVTFLIMRFRKVGRCIALAYPNNHKRYILPFCILLEYTKNTILIARLKINVLGK